MREASVLTPSAPTELSVITLAFALASFGLLFIVARIFFFGGFSIPRLIARLNSHPHAERIFESAAGSAHTERQAPARALLVADAVTQMMRREEEVTGGVNRSRIIDRSLRGNEPRASTLQAAAVNGTMALGSSFRANHSRNYRRTSGAGAKRDNKA
jgi:type IV secretion system protein VirB6